MAVNGLPGAAAVSAGEDEACAVLSGGNVDCWGAKGDVTGVNPFAVSGVSNAIAVGEGGSQAGGCAVVSGGSVECWGNTTLPVATPLSGVSNAVAVSVGTLPGSDQGCVVLSDGGVDCWGDGFYGDLGNGTHDVHSSTPVAVSGISTAVAVGVGLYYACAVLSGGTVECWGFNAGGELGTPTKAPGIESDVPVPVTGITDATAIGVGEESACAVLSDGQVQCWGQNAEGELGDGTFTGPETCAVACSRTPVTVSGLGTAIGVSVGSQQACAVLSGGTVECWGANYAGQLGNGTTTNSDVPVRVGELIPRREPTPTPGTHETPGTPGTPKAGNPPASGTLSFSSASSPAHKTPRPTAAVVFSLPSAKQCVSRRRFTVHVRRYPGITWIGAVIKINGKRIKSIGRSHITAYVNLVGLPKGTFVLSITATASNGLKVTGMRTYHTCVPKSKRHHGPGKL